MLPPLARLRAFLGVSQRELAHLLNMSHGLLAKIETGQRNTPPLLQAALAQWMLALDLAEGVAGQQAPPADLPGQAWLRKTLARHERECRRLEAAIAAERPRVQAFVQQQQRWAALEQLLPQFPAMDPGGFALLRDRRRLRHTGWLPARLAAEEATLAQLQALVQQLRLLVEGQG